MGFLKILLIAVLVYYLVKILFRMFAPQLFGYAAKRTERHFQEKFRQFTEGLEPEEEEGSITINKKTNSGKQTSKDIGEYIDFEELE